MSPQHPLVSRQRQTLLLASLFVLGCAATVPASAPASGGPSAAAAPTKADATATVRTKGNNSGVSLRYVVPEKIAVGERVTLRLQFAGINAPDGATVDVRDPAARTTLLTLQLKQGEQKEVELPYTGRADGMQFIDVTTTQAGRSTVQSVPLRVGSGKPNLKTEGQRSTTPAGEAVISLPAATPPSSGSR